MIKWNSVETLPMYLNKHYLTYSKDIEGSEFRILSPSSSKNKFPSSVTHWAELEAPKKNKS